MRLSNLNSAIDLPKLLKEELGDHPYKFKKIPYYGWFAYTEDYSDIKNISNFFPGVKLMDIYKKVTTTHKHLLHIDMPYDPQIAKELAKDYLNYVEATKALEQSIVNYKTSYINHKGKVVPAFTKLAIDGYEGLQLQDVGLVTKSIISSNPVLMNLASTRYRTLLIPIYHTPKHLSGLAQAPFANPEDIKMVWKFGDEGWLGPLCNRVVSSYKDTFTQPGFTWSKIQDFWTRDMVSLDKSLSIADLIKIWRSTQYTTFDQNPQSYIIKKQENPETLNAYLSDLSIDEIKELEEISGWKLRKGWSQGQKVTCKIAFKEYVRKNNKLYIKGKGDELVEIQNFAITLCSCEVIRGEKDDIYWNSILYIDNSQLPLRFKDESFHNIDNLMSEITKAAITYGCSIPFITSGYRVHIPEIVLKTSPDIKTFLREQVDPPANTKEP